MTSCDFCGIEIEYLPFRCKYCGSTYCKKHRLPENHECNFELKHTPVVPTSQALQVQSSEQKSKSKSTREFKKYLKRQEKERKKDLKSQESRSYDAPKFTGTKVLLLLIVVLTILGSIFIPYLRFSLHYVLFKFQFQTIFTSFFISPIIFSLDLFLFLDIIFFGLMLFFAYFIARSLEYLMGTKFLFKLYLISTVFAMLFYIGLRLLFHFAYPIQIEFNTIVMGFAYAGIFGLMTYTIFPVRDQSLTALMYFIPIRMKGRSFLLMIILLRLIPGLFFALWDPRYLIIYLPDLGGILGAYIFYKIQSARI